MKSGEVHMGKILLDRAEKIAEAIVAKLKPYCKQIEIAGSIRRRRPFIGDIDIVLIPSDPWNLHQEILGMCRPFPAKMSGSKIMRVTVVSNSGPVQVDIYFADETTWATLLLIRTGSTENNIRLCLRAKQRGWHLAADGSGLFNEAGQRIAGDSEQSIYEALGLPYQEPWERK
jgi:DNA polymerase (family 10)